eukprot:CAMPEP_0185620006 /NCGR_PEP_ID=MMETSP0436-20130131/52578_1 /TAXON_ID=626734 ORGANISM="Favella taraikaensis, Strain Fe Narragansett Bay" /NCGR_SAMPLE_ID=MMETSP0436 /ASSEMBLY_ACC=CAM_ASM_000390 /LENGTH=61 /DNA_ID=CAMNT_0028259983 /DNA_START=103 /DNA_END=288 /DNA_ORIENTATION=+
MSFGGVGVGVAAVEESTSVASATVFGGGNTAGWEGAPVDIDIGANSRLAVVVRGTRGSRQA